MDMDVDEVDFTDEQFLMDLVKQWVQDNPEIFIDEESEIHTRNRGPKIDYWQTEWGRLILQQEIY